MPTFFCRQPNGKLCRFSTIVDTITHYNLTEDELIEMMVEDAKRKARDIIKSRLRPYEWIDDYFVPNNMTRAEFEQIKREMEK